jgi:hypothetical protein
MRRGEVARNAHATGDALRSYDEALTAIEELKPVIPNSRYLFPPSGTPTPTKNRLSLLRPTFT